MKKHKFTLMDQMNKLNKKDPAVLNENNVREEYKELLSIDFYGLSPFEKIVKQFLKMLKDQNVPLEGLHAPFIAAMNFNPDLLRKELSQLSTMDMLSITKLLDSINNR